jgi:hypothetical protein
VADVGGGGFSETTADNFAARGGAEQPAFSGEGPVIQLRQARSVLEVLRLDWNGQEADQFADQSNCLIDMSSRGSGGNATAHRRR